MGTKATTSLIAELGIFKEFFGGKTDIPAQHLLTFLHIAQREETPLADLEELTGVAQSSVSRNVATLGKGPNPREPGYFLIDVYEDPFHRRRKLAKLTARGRELVKELEKVHTKFTSTK